MANFLTSLIPQSIRRGSTTVEPIQPAGANPGYAYGVVPGDALTKDKNLLGQMWQVDHHLLYGVYQHHPDVYAAVNKWMGGVTASGWHVEAVEEELGDNARLQPAIEELTDRFRHANPYQTYDELLKETVMHLGISGDAYWYKLKTDTSNRAFDELWGLHPALIHILATVHGEVLGYVMRAMSYAEPVIFTPDEIIHFRLPNPTHDLYGLPPLQPALEEVRADFHMLQENMAYFVNGMTPQSLVLLNDTTAPEDAKKLMSQLKQEHQGSTKSHKLAAILGAKDIKVLSGNLKDAEFIEGRQLQTAKIAAAFEVPEVLLGYHNRGDYATSDVLERLFYQNKIVPLQKLIAEGITDGIVGLENPDLQFAFDAIDFTDQDSKRADYLTAQAQGILTADEVRAEIFDLAPLEAHDEDESPDSGPTDSNDTEVDSQTDPLTDDAPDNQPQPAATPASNKSVHKASDPQATDRDALAAARYQQLEELAAALVPALAHYFAGQQQQYLDNLSAGLSSGDLDGFVADASADAKLHMLLFGLLVASLNAGSQAGQLQVGVSLGFDKTNPFIQDYLHTQALAHAKGINATTQKALQQELSDGLANGESVDQLATRIQSVFAEAQGYRSQLIARTETAQAYEYANQQALKASGVVAMREWLGAEDERECPICSALDGTTAPIDQPFDGGAEPGSVHVQCRCTSVGVVS